MKSFYVCGKNTHIFSAPAAGRWQRFLFCSRASARLIIIYFTMSAERLYQCRNWVLLCSRAALRQIWIGFTMSAECLYQCKIMVYATALAWDHDRIAFAKSTERLYQCQKRILLCSRACKNIPSTKRKYLSTLIQSLAPQAKNLRVCSFKSYISLLFQALRRWENTRKTLKNL